MGGARWWRRVLPWAAAAAAVLAAANDGASASTSTAGDSAAAEATHQRDVWGDCLDDRCFKLLGPKQSLAELEQACVYLGGRLGALHSDGGDGKAEARMAHWHALFEREAGSQGLLYVGARLGDDGTVASFSDGSAVTAADGALFASAFSLGSGFGGGSGHRCVGSRQHVSSGSILWQAVACDAPAGVGAFAVCEHALPEHGFCYEVRWLDDKQRQRKRTINPVQKFPTGHPKASEPGVCGVADAFGFVPPRGQWSLTGTPAHGADECSWVSGGELFYAYNNPMPSSSNTGYDRDNSLVMFFVQDTDYRGYWVVVIDSPEGSDQDIGMLELLITSRGLGQDVDVLLYDDVPLGPMGENCTVEAIRQTSHGIDCYDWRKESGSGRFLWRWNKCCTDGMVLGALPAEDFCLEVAVGSRFNLHHLLLADYEDEQIKLSSKVPIDSPIEVCGYQCPFFCERIATCGECASTPGCGWCPSFGCEAVGARDGCPEGHGQADGSGWLDRSSEACCPACALHHSCQSCAAEAGCGWDTVEGRCSSGNAFSRDLCLADEANSELFAFAADECLLFQPTKSPSARPSNAPSEGPTGAPTTAGPTDAPSAEPSPSPTTGTPSKEPTTEPTRAPGDNAEKGDGPDNGPGGDGSDGGPDGDTAVVVAVVVPLLLLLLLLLACCGWRRYWAKKSGGQDEFDSIGGMAGAAAGAGAAGTTSTAATVYAHRNPMFADMGEIALEDKDNALVAALRAAKAQDAIIHLYTNCPGIAMTLSHEGKCFVKCMDEGGAILDSVTEQSGFVNKLKSLASSAFGKRSAHEVRVDLKVKKLDEWTRHTDPFAVNEDKQEFFYNGKLNKVEFDAVAVKIKQRKNDGEPLRWQFAPDEFDNFDHVMQLLSAEKWRKLKHRPSSSRMAQEDGIMGTYFVNPRTKERVWLE